MHFQDSRGVCTSSHSVVLVTVLFLFCTSFPPSFILRFCFTTVCSILFIFFHKREYKNPTFDFFFLEYHLIEIYIYFLKYEYHSVRVLSIYQIYFYLFLLLFSLFLPFLFSLILIFLFLFIYLSPARE